MFHSNIGELAALASALCCTVSPIAFETAGKKVGSLSVNYLKLIFAFVFTGLYTLVNRGMFLPLDASLTNWTWLFVSGIIGFVIGDLFLFQAYIEIGSRLSTLIMATVPPISAIAGYFILGERLSSRDLLGMLITLAGIALVILVKGSDEKKIKLSHPLKGLIYALIGAFGQAFGLICSKFGMGNYDPFAATQIRVISAFVGFTIVITIAKGWKNLFSTFKDASAMKSITIGSIFGPFLGVALSLLSVQYTATGIASTISSISRILIIPASMVIFKEKVSAKEVIGALITILGVGILFL
ncbi:EamA family transporter [Clostridium manihotivorum]|uniref:EamA family transporter n=1 Tax=Clostridium manihotivorum TaxID=2320868 RepID=A0A410DRZ9_9CLOT|nr:EamA family transporter [Clostridium manihotivorum]